MTYKTVRGFSIMRAKGTVAVYCVMWIVLLGMHGPDALAKQQDEPVLLSEGVLLTAAQGNLVKHVSERTWSFRVKDEFSVGQIKLKAGARFALLSSAVFEAMLADQEEHANATYLLWGRVTRYKGRNYLFPLSFMLLNEAAPPPAKSDDAPATENKDQVPVETALEDELIPEFITKLRQGPSVVRPRTAKTYTKVPPNKIALDRTGYLKQQEQAWVFVHAGLGQNRLTKQVRLLPCALLESMEQQQAQSPETLYFRVAGMHTLFKGQTYLLLRRATRAYSHGNFKR
jgi:hypothetical protein